MNEQETVRFAIVTAPIDVARVVSLVEHAEAGAIDIFLGVVRNHADGHPVVLLEYEAYLTMAHRELERCARDVELHFKNEVRLAATHRIGRMEVGDVAVVCAASSPHRHEAFSACRMLIDEIKARVPIWKREHGPDGPYWVGWRDARCNETDHPLHGHACHKHHPGHEHHHEPR